MLKIKNNKGIQLAQAFGAVLIVVLVGVLVIVAILLFSQVGTSFAGTVSASSLNEAVTPETNGTLLDGAFNCSAGAFAISSVENNSAGGEVIPASNYTVSNIGLFQNTSDFYTGNDWNVNYTYTWGSAACTASQDLVTQFATYPALVGLVGTIIFLGLVIGILVASFVFGGRRGV